MRDGAVEVFFTGLDRGLEEEVVQSYQRSLSLGGRAPRRGAARLRAERRAAAAAARLSAAAARARLVRDDERQVARRISVLDASVRGLPDGEAVPAAARRGRPGDAVDADGAARAAVPPGIPDFHTRERHLEPGRVPCFAAARGPARRRSPRSRSASTAARRGATAELERDVDSQWAWCGVDVRLGRAPGRHELCCPRPRRGRQRAAARRRVERRRLRATTPSTASSSTSLRDMSGVRPRTWLQPDLPFERCRIASRVGRTPMARSDIVLWTNRHRLVTA